MQDSLCRSSWNLDQLRVILTLKQQCTTPFWPAILLSKISCAFFQTSLQSLIFVMCLLSHILLNLINPIPEQCFSLFHPLLRTPSHFSFLNFCLCRYFVTLLFNCFSESIYSTIPDSSTLLIPLGCTCRCHKQTKSARECKFRRCF